MRLPPMGPDGAGLVRRTLRRSPVRHLLRIWWKTRGITPNDVIIASYPRAGNLWLRYMLVTLLTGDADIGKVTALAPGLWNLRNPPSLVPGGGRIIKTHERHQRAYRRAIHLVRDPRDAAVSYFGLALSERFMAIPAGMNHDVAFDRFIDAFIGGRIDAYGTWQQHLDSWTAAADNGRVDLLRIRYEDLRADPVATLDTIARWLGLDKSTDEITRAVELSSLEHMKGAAAAFKTTETGSRPGSAHPMINRGQVGGWRDILTERQQRKFDAFALGLEQLGYLRA